MTVVERINMFSSVFNFSNLMAAKLLKESVREYQLILIATRAANFTCTVNVILVSSPMCMCEHMNISVCFF